MADQALRLVFRHDEAGVSLESTDRIEMRIPPADSPPASGPAPIGLFAELRSGEGRPLFTRALSHEDPLVLEYPTGDPQREFGRTRSTEPVLVSVLVPAHPEARSVALVRAAMPRGFFSLFMSGPRRRDVAVFPLPAEGGQ